MLSIERIQRELATWDVSRLQKLKDYYDGKHDILSRTMDAGKPNNKLVHNYPSYIVDVFQGYFIGNPVVYSGDEKTLEAIQDILNYNDEQDENSEIARQAGIFGRGGEVLYIDEAGQVRFRYCDPLQLKIIYDNSIDPRIIGAIRKYSIEDDAGEVTEYADVYDDMEVVTYKVDGWIETNREQTFFMDVPVIDYMNNSDVTGDFEGVISLVDAYNLSRSNKTNDLEYFTDAYLYLIGLMGTTAEEIADMKNNRTLLFNELTGGQLPAGFLVKPSNVEEAKEQIRQLNEDIHKFSKAVDLSDENFANGQSGIAMEWKLFIMDQITANKERKFKKGLQRRLELICNYLNFRGASFNYLDITMKFERNKPIDVQTNVATALQLNGFVSKETALSALPSSIVSDVNAEIEKLADEADQYTNSTFLTDATAETEVVTDDGQAESN
jgi:SPP1 family phage portal protein